MLEKNPLPALCLCLHIFLQVVDFLIIHFALQLLFMLATER